MDRGSILARLRELDTCTLSDALDRLALPPSQSGLRPQSVVGRICGQVVTVKLASGTPTMTVSRHLCTTAIETAEPGDIIVVEQRTGLDAAGWGGILSNAAKQAGLGGVIVEGPARDIDEARDIGFPVYSRTATARTARGRIHEMETAGQVRIGDVIVSNRDYVAIDSSGAVFVPAEQVENVLAVAEEIARRETAMTRDVLAGTPVGRVMGVSYEAMLTGAHEPGPA